MGLGGRCVGVLNEVLCTWEKLESVSSLQFEFSSDASWC
jgi:hypothetical protein